jgi:hypothetical protein
MQLAPQLALAPQLDVDPLVQAEPDEVERRLDRHFEAPAVSTRALAAGRRSSQGPHTDACGCLSSSRAGAGTRGVARAPEERFVRTQRLHPQISGAGQHSMPKGAEIDHE